MTDYSAGSATATYKIDLSQFRKDADEIRKFWAEQAKQRPMAPPPIRPPGGTNEKSSADALLNSQVRAARATGDHAKALSLLDAAIDKTTAGGRRYNDLLTQRAGVERQVAADVARTERTIRQLADTEVRAARATGDYARATQIIDAQLERATQGTARYNQLVAQRANVERQASGNTRLAADGFRALSQAAAAFGLGFGLAQLTQFAIQSYTLSQQLASQEQSLRVLTRDQGLYNEAIGIAKQNQALFGGSLSENIDPLRTLALNAQRYGIELKTLNDLAQRLVVLSPEQGAAGAGLALREALSGDTQSLVERFELPRAALAGIRDTSISAADKLKIVDSVLSSYGVTSQTVKDSLTSAAIAQNRFNTELQALQVTAGAGAAPVIERITNGLSRLLGLLNDNPQALAELRAIFSGKGSIDQGDIEKATRDTAAADVNRQLGGTTAGGTNYAALGKTGELTDDRLAAIKEQLIAAKVAGGEYATVADKILQGWQDGSVGAQDLANRATLLTDAIAAAGQQTASTTPLYGAWTTAVDETNVALGEQITKAQDAKETSDQLGTAQATLAQVSQLVAAGLLSSKDAAAFMAAQYGLALPVTEELINAQNRLAAARLNAANASNVLSAQAKINQDRLAGRTGRGDSSDASEIADAATRQAKAIQDAKDAQLRATGSGAQQIALLRRELGQLVPGTAAYIDKQTELIQKQKQLDAERIAAGKKGAAAAKTDLSDAQRTADELVRIKRDQLQKLADAEYEYRQKLQRAQEDFNVGAARDEEDYQKKRRKLLAEGNRVGASELQTDYELSKKRDQEDETRKRRRTVEDYRDTQQRTLRDQDERTGDTQDKRDLRSAQRGYGGGTTAASASTPVLRPPSIAGAAGVTDAQTVAALAPRQVNVAFQGTVVLDGQKVGELIGPSVVAQVDESLVLGMSITQTANAPGLQQASVREVR